ncbi:MAG: polyamine aminopropyltransferase [Pseudomonadota bacterium]
MTDRWFEETLYPHHGQRLKVAEILHREKTDYQDLVIFENPQFGRVLALDGNVQTTEADEFFYHEMLVHPAIFAHGEVKKALIIGGGDGGALREALKHPIEKATLIEIDSSVVELSKKYLPAISGHAFKDPRTELIIQDGTKFVAETDERFDVILVDSTDPIGPATVLFQKEFYTNCKRCLTERGILIAQNGVPFLQPEEARGAHRLFRGLFPDSSFLVVPVPTYVGGFMTLGWASLSEKNRAVSRDTIERRFAGSGVSTRYYNPDIHLAAFALPTYIRELMG